MNFQAVKGMEDWYPDDFSVRSQVFDRLRKTAQAFGFKEVESPAIESIKLLTAKSGEETKEQIFLLEKKGTEELGLRFDLTVPITRMFVAKQREIQKPVKWFCLSRMWRYEAPQKGRLREFYQLSVELFGSDKPAADADVLNLLLSCFTALGLTSKDIVVRLNNRKLLEGLLRSVTQKPVEQLFRLVDKSSKITPEELDAQLAILGLTGKEAGRVKEIISIRGSPNQVMERIRTLAVTEAAKQGLAELDALFRLVPLDFIELDCSIARGLAYYTGTVYEIFDREGKYRALAGGGRYDELVGLFGGEATPATGAAIGYATLSLLLQEKGLLPKPQLAPDYYIAVVKPELIPEAMVIANKLRKKATVDIDLMERKLAKQLEYANALKAKRVIVIGSEELKQQSVKVKDMESGKEYLVGIGELVYST